MSTLSSRMIPIAVALIWVILVLVPIGLTRERHVQGTLFASGDAHGVTLLRQLPSGAFSAIVEDVKRVALQDDGLVVETGDGSYFHVSFNIRGASGDDKQGPMNPGSMQSVVKWDDAALSLVTKSEGVLSYLRPVFAWESMLYAVCTIGAVGLGFCRIRALFLLPTASLASIFGSVALFWIGRGGGPESIPMTLLSWLIGAGGCLAVRDTFPRKRAVQGAFPVIAKAKYVDRDDKDA